MNRETGAPLCDALAGWIAGPLPAAPPDWDEQTWEDFRTVAQVHGAAGLLWLRARGVPAWAASPLGLWLADQHLWNARRIERLHGELGEILRLFWDEGVPLLPLKGAVLGPLYYEDAAARPMADLDVLLRDEHGEAGEALLARLGYAKTFSGWKHARFARPGSEGIADPTREHPDNPRQLEVHPRCRERLRDEVIDLTDLMWGTASRGELLGAPSWLPAPEALWLHLLVHATHHILLNNFRLIQLADLARLAPAVADPAGVAATVDARATYPALALLGRYKALTPWPPLPPPHPTSPGEGERNRTDREISRQDPSQGSPLSQGGGRAWWERGTGGEGFAAWADSLDLYEVCHLNPVPWRAG